MSYIKCNSLKFRCKKLTSLQFCAVFDFAPRTSKPCPTLTRSRLRKAILKHLFSLIFLFPISRKGIYILNRLTSTATNFFSSLFAPSQMRLQTSQRKSNNYVIKLLIYFYWFLNGLAYNFLFICIFHSYFVLLFEFF